MPVVERLIVKTDLQNRWSVGNLAMTLAVLLFGFNTNTKSIRTLTLAFPHHCSMGGSLELKRVRRLISRVAKSIMKSHHLRVPKYEMPIRFRPVITTIPLLYLLLIMMVAVVSRLYMLHNGRSCIPGVYKLFKIITSQ